MVLWSGLFFVLPCTDSYTKVDLRTVSFDVPPQEVCDCVCVLDDQSFKVTNDPVGKWFFGG